MAGHYDRSTMKRAGTDDRVKTDPEAYKQQFYQRGGRGRPTKGVGSMSFEQLYKGEAPRTPFEKLRFDLKLTQIEWAKEIQMTHAAVSAVDRGHVIATVPVAKRMQEEARKRGIAVTLDELYQHVITWQIEPAP